MTTAVRFEIVLIDGDEELTVQETATLAEAMPYAEAFQEDGDVAVREVTRRDVALLVRSRQTFAPKGI